jgi:hypothetical protein
VVMVRPTPKLKLSSTIRLEYAGFCRYTVEAWVLVGVLCERRTFYAIYMDYQGIKGSSTATG